MLAKLPVRVLRHTMLGIASPPTGPLPSAISPAVAHSIRSRTPAILLQIIIVPNLIWARTYSLHPLLRVRKRIFILVPGPQLWVLQLGRPPRRIARSLRVALPHDAADFIVQGPLLASAWIILLDVFALLRVACRGQTAALLGPPPLAAHGAFLAARLLGALELLFQAVLHLVEERWELGQQVLFQHELGVEARGRGKVVGLREESGEVGRRLWFWGQRGLAVEGCGLILCGTLGFLEEAALQVVVLFVFRWARLAGWGPRVGGYNCAFRRGVGAYVGHARVWGYALVGVVCVLFGVFSGVYIALVVLDARQCVVFCFGALGVRLECFSVLELLLWGAYVAQLLLHRPEVVVVSRVPFVRLIEGDGLLLRSGVLGLRPLARLLLQLYLVVKLVLEISLFDSRVPEFWLLRTRVSSFVFLRIRVSGFVFLRIRVPGFVFLCIRVSVFRLLRSWVLSPARLLALSLKCCDVQPPIFGLENCFSVFGLETCNVAAFTSYLRSRSLVFGLAVGPASGLSAVPGLAALELRLTYPLLRLRVPGLPQLVAERLLHIGSWGHALVVGRRQRLLQFFVDLPLLRHQRCVQLPLLHGLRFPVQFVRWVGLAAAHLVRVQYLARSAARQPPVLVRLADGGPPLYLFPARNRRALGLHVRHRIRLGVGVRKRVYLRLGARKWV